MIADYRRTTILGIIARTLLLLRSSLLLSLLFLFLASPLPFFSLFNANICQHMLTHIHTCTFLDLISFEFFSRRVELISPQFNTRLISSQTTNKTTTCVCLFACLFLLLLLLLLLSCFSLFIICTLSCLFIVASY